MSASIARSRTEERVTPRPWRKPNRGKEDLAGHRGFSPLLTAQAPPRLEPEVPQLAFRQRHRVLKDYCHPLSPRQRFTAPLSWRSKFAHAARYPISRTPRSVPAATTARPATMPMHTSISARVKPRRVPRIRVPPSASRVARARRPGRMPTALRPTAPAPDPPSRFLHPNRFHSRPPGKPPRRPIRCPRGNFPSRSTRAPFARSHRLRDTKR